MARKIGGLKQLGNTTPIPKSPGEAELERVPNPHPSRGLCGALLVS